MLFKIIRYIFTILAALFVLPTLWLIVSAIMSLCFAGLAVFFFGVLVAEGNIQFKDS